MTSRRSFMKTTALGALATEAALPAQDAEAGYIDAHVHVWTADTARYPVAEGSQKAGLKQASFTPGDLFVHSEPQGVKRTVLIQMSFYKYDNRYMIDMMERHAGVFSGVAIVDDNQPKPYAMMRLLAKAG